jgi:hypothetical protein
MPRLRLSQSHSHSQRPPRPRQELDQRPLHRRDPRPHHRVPVPQLLLTQGEPNARQRVGRRDSPAKGGDIFQLRTWQRFVTCFDSLHTPVSLISFLLPFSCAYLPLPCQCFHARRSTGGESSSLYVPAGPYIHTIISPLPWTQRSRLLPLLICGSAPPPYSASPRGAAHHRETNLEETGSQPKYVHPLLSAALISIRVKNPRAR